MSVVGHDAEMLKGSYEDPATNALVETENSVGWWWSIGQPERLMAALSDPRNGWIIPGDATNSRFARELLSGRRPMARFLSHPIPEIGGKTARQIILGWINAGALLPEDRTRPGHLSARLRLMAAMPARSGAPLHDDYAAEVTRRTLSARRYTPRERAAFRRRPLNPGGGAAH